MNISEKDGSLLLELNQININLTHILQSLVYRCYNIDFGLKHPNFNGLVTIWLNDLVKEQNNIKITRVLEGVEEENTLHLIIQIGLLGNYFTVKIDTNKEIFNCVTINTMHSFSTTENINIFNIKYI